MKKLLTFSLVLVLGLFLSTCGGSDGGKIDNPALLQNTIALVPSITSVAAASIKVNTTADLNFNRENLGSIPIMIYGDYVKTLALANDNAAITTFNLGGVFSNAKAIVDTIPVAASEAGTVTATWMDYVFPVTMSAVETPTAATVSPFDFGSRSAAPSAYESLRTSTITCTNCSFTYNSNASGAWKNADNTFYMLYAEDANPTENENTYVIQGNYNSSTGSLVYNQANRGSAGSTRSRIEVTGNINTKLGLVRVVVVDGSYRLATISKGVVGTGDTIMRVKISTSGSIASATEYWICFNTDAKIEDFQSVFTATGPVSTDAGKIQIATSSADFTGTCATSAYITDVAAETFFDETSVPDTASMYYSTLK